MSPSLTGSFTKQQGTLLSFKFSSIKKNQKAPRRCSNILPLEIIVRVLVETGQKGVALLIIVGTFTTQSVALSSNDQN